jgi:hypothetical protein
MGLDIYAVSRVERVTTPESTDDGINVWQDGFDRIAGLEVGIYQPTSKSEEHEFRAGSYSHYNWFRRNLSLMIYGQTSEVVWMNKDAFEGRPFYELIDFSDCEGVFGPEVSEKLHSDFETNRPNMIKYCLDNFINDDTTYDNVMEIYDDFTKAFKLASKDGLVLFT